jgi:hypothetical protein
MDASQYTPPQFVYDLLAEQAILKFGLYGDELALQLCGELINTFYNGKHKQLAAVLSSMYLNSQRVDLVSVLGQVSARGLITKLDGPYLHTVYTGPGDHSGVRWYGDRLRKLAARRALRDAALRVTQHLDYAWGTGDDDMEGEAIQLFRSALDEVELSARPDGGPVPISMAEFLDGPMEFNWMVPGLLERGERIILTGSEGLGKSVLTSQIGAAMAGGVHPFTGAVLGGGDRGIRVTVVDCENSAVQSRRRFKRIISQVDHLRIADGFDPADWKQQISIEIRPEGINLLKLSDMAWLEHAITATAPDLLVLGPLYKLFNDDPSNETTARAVVSVLDGLRARHGFALLTEAHAGKSEDGAGNRRMAPIGSSLWMRWPEYGFGVRRAKAAQEKRAELVDVVSWRGSREERQWPDQLRHGFRLPWEPPPERPHADSGDGEEPEGGWYR